MENNQPQSKLRKTSPLRYGIGMFGTSIPINMFKTYAAIFYVDNAGAADEAVFFGFIDLHLCRCD